MIASAGECQACEPYRAFMFSRGKKPIKCPECGTKMDDKIGFDMKRNYLDQIQGKWENKIQPKTNESNFINTKYRGWFVMRELIADEKNYNRANRNIIFLANQLNHFGLNTLSVVEFLRKLGCDSIAFEYPNIDLDFPNHREVEHLLSFIDEPIFIIFCDGDYTTEIDQSGKFPSKNGKPISQKEWSTYGHCAPNMNISVKLLLAKEIFEHFPCLKSKQIANKYTKLFHDNKNYDHWPFYSFSRMLLMYEKNISEEAINKFIFTD